MFIFIITMSLFQIKRYHCRGVTYMDTIQYTPQSSQDQFEDLQQGQFLTFRIEDGVYGIETRYVTGIMGVLPFVPMPEMHSYMKGIIRLRDGIIPAMDVRLRFNKPEKEYDDRTCFIMVNVDGREMALIVDQVAEVLTIPAEDIMTPPNFGGYGVQFVCGVAEIDGELKQLLDGNRLLEG